MEPQNNSKQRILTELEAEIRVLQDYAAEDYIDRPRLRLCLESLFVLFCGSLGWPIVWLLDKLIILPEWIVLPAAVVMSVAFAIAAVWSCVELRQKQKRQSSLRDQLNELE